MVSKPTLDERITAIAGDFPYLLNQLTEARSQIGDARVIQFLDMFPETSEALMLRFRKWVAGKPEVKHTGYMPYPEDFPDYRDFLVFSNFVVNTIYPDRMR